MGEKQLNNLATYAKPRHAFYQYMLYGCRWNNLFELEIYIGGAPKCTNNVAFSI